MKVIRTDVINYNGYPLADMPSKYEVVLEHEKTVQDVYDSVLEFQKVFNPRPDYWDLTIKEGFCKEWVLASSIPSQCNYNGPMSLKVKHVTAYHEPWKGICFEISVKED